MRSRLFSLLCISLATLSVACSDSNNSNGNSTPPEPEVSLEETGIYSGSVVTDEGDVALMRLTLARDGSTAVTLQTDDTEQATILLWGESDGSEGSITFSGSDTDTGDSASVDFLVEGDSASGRLELSNITGDFQLLLDAFSDRASNSGVIAGEYARNDNTLGITQLTIDNDGNASLTGACEATGSVSAIDDTVNIYQLELDGDCITLSALVSMQDLEESNDVLATDGDAGDSGISLAFYRL